MPFIAFLIWQAHGLGLTRRSAFSMGLLLCAIVMLFPWALQHQWTVEWILLLSILIIAGILWPILPRKMAKQAQIRKIIEPVVENNTNELEAPVQKAPLLEAYLQEVSMDNDENGAHRERVLELENVAQEIHNVEEQIFKVQEAQEVQEVQEVQVVQEVQEVQEVQVVQEVQEVQEEAQELLKGNGDPNRELGHLEEGVEHPVDLNEWIDKGFQAKAKEDFEQAAFYFSRALSLDPMPDIAFYLIIDCYWLWSNLGKREVALTQLRSYVLKYLPEFNPQLRRQFDLWLTKENLHKILE